MRKELEQDKKTNESTKTKKRVFQYNSPSIFEEENKYYISALEESIDKEDVFNIGIIAPYGSGKSSLVKTFFNKHPKKKKKACNVTLANFSEKIDNNEFAKRRVEKSIVEQILFTRKHSWLSKSAFPRLHGRIGATLGFSALLVSTIAAIILTILKFYGVLPFDCGVSFYLYFGLSTFLSFTTMFLAFYVLRIRKVAFRNIEVEIESSQNSSILNLFIDEIINFCAETNTQYFVFEDIDRFDCDSLFLNLKEINKLINGSVQIKQKVTFIYCIKDGMFENAEDRTKFFDFIISLVPIFNPNNAREFVIDAIKKNEDNSLLIDESLIIEACTYIKEKRVLNNIVNDYIMYHDRLNINDKDNNKLFAMMVYKNLNEKDFANLQCNSGDLYDIFNTFKEKAIFKATESINNSIIECQTKLSGQFPDVEDSLKALRQRISGILIENGNLVISLPSQKGKMINNKTVSRYEKDIEYLYIDFGITTYHYGSTTNYKFLDINSIKHHLDNKTPFEVQEEIVENSKERYKNALIELGKKQNQCASMSVSALISAGFFDEKELENIKSKNNYLFYAITNDYIDESYFKFSGKQDTEFDKTYIDKVLTNASVDPEKKIQNPSLVISILPPNRFKTKSVLNYSLVDCLLSDKKEYRTKKEFLLNHLATNKDTIPFIVGYLLNGRQQQKLIYEFKRVGYYSLINDVVSVYKDSGWQTTQTIKEIIKSGKNNQSIIDFFNQDNQISTVINECSNPIETYFSSYESVHSFVSFLKHINATKLKHIDDIGENSSKEIMELFSIITENCLYEINAWNVSMILKYYFKDNKINATIFLKAKNRDVSDYFLANISDFINVLTFDESKFSDDIDISKKVLLSDDLSDELKIKYSLHLNNKLVFIDGLSLALYETLIANNILFPSFETISKIMAFKEIDKSIIINFIKDNSKSFEDRISKELFIGIANLEETNNDIVKILCSYYNGKIEMGDIKTDSKRKIAIENNLIELNSNSLNHCREMIQSIIACLNKNEELVDYLPSAFAVNDDRNYISLLNSLELVDKAKALILAKYFDKTLSFVNENSEAMMRIVFSFPDLSYNFRLLSTLLKNASDIEDISKLLDICRNVLSNKDLVYVVKENDPELFGLLTTSNTNRITINLSIADNNIYFKMLEKRHLIRQLNRRKNNCNVYVDVFNSLFKES